MKKLEKLIKETEYLSQHYVEIGILAEDKERKPLGKKTTILEYAIFNEFGTSKTPSRPFFRITLEEKRNDIKRKSRQYFNEVLRGQSTGREVLIKIGEDIRELIIQTINNANQWATPLSPATLQAKLKKRANNNKILIDDRYLIKSIRFKIVHIKGNVEFISGFKEV